MENGVEQEVEIDLGELFKKLLKQWKFIVLTCFVTTLAAILITIFFIPKQYESRISMYVNNNQKSSEAINMNDINVSKSLVNTYMALLKSDCIMDMIVNEINKGSSEEQYGLQAVKGMITCNQVNGTEIFEVIVKTGDPELSAHIAEYIGEIAPVEISRVFKSGSVEIVDRAKVPEYKCAPSVTANTIIGGFIGLIISCGTVVLASMMNQKVNEPKDFENKYDIPLLGIIPDRLKN